MNIKKEYFQLIENSKVYEILEPTPLSYSQNLSKKLKNQIYLKREDLQKVFSFKIRGAFNKIANLAVSDRALGIITASAGNHAQGVAFSGSYFNCKTLIVMPKTTPTIKINAVKKFGAEVLLVGDSFQESANYAIDLAKKEQLLFVHPYDDPLVIAGQGTIAKELLEQLATIDYIFLPIGGGGLASGVGAYIKEVKPEIKIIGVEPYEAPSMYEALKANQRVSLDWVGNFADGVAVKQVGEENFRLCSEVIDDIILVHTDEICSAVKDAFEDIRVILEPSGALSIAGAKKYIKLNKLEKKNIVAIASGANVNFNRLRHIAERAELGEKKEIIVAVELDEKPGSLKRFCISLGERSITEFNYRYAEEKKAQIFVGISIINREDKEKLFDTLRTNNIIFEDLSNSELAKVHIRHMIGGRVRSEHRERIIRFEFPEKLGALMYFLETMNSKWNISLFHYRSHGSDRARVLVGLQVPTEEDESFNEFLKVLDYQYWDETDNIACNLFL